MFKLHTFKELIKEKCEDKIFERIRVYVEDNPDKFEGYSDTIDTPDEAELSDIDIKFVTVNENLINGLKFDVVVAAEIEVSQRMPHSYSDSDGIEQRFRVSCSAIFNNGLYNFKANQIYFYNKSRYTNDGGLSEYLIPIICKEKLDDIAEDFLKRYYPKALEKPMGVDVKELAQSMGLKIELRNITKTCSVFGQVYFSNCKTNYYDGENRKHEELEVERGTILVDPDIFFMRCIGSVNNTIVHECVHWDMHRLFFDLQKIFNAEISKMFCKVKETEKNEKIWSPFDWMEWQANHIAPRILMPASTTRIMIEELLKKNKKALPDGNMADILESVIFELAELYGVSKLSAKIRMLDLGYKEVEGIHTFVDDHYVANYLFETKALNDGQTYTISDDDFLYQYAANLEFRKIVDSGKFIFVENHYCINDSKYVKNLLEGHPILTDYARQHVDECCLVFDVKLIENKKYGTKYYSECALFRSAVESKLIEVVYKPSKEKNKLIEQRADDIFETANEVSRILKEVAGLEFYETLNYHMARKHVTKKDLVNTSLIKGWKIKDMRNNPDKEWKYGEVVAICIGLQLYPDFSFDLLNKAGKNLTNKPLHMVYKILLSNHYREHIYYCNEILRKYDYPILGKEE